MDLLTIVAVCTAIIAGLLGYYVWENYKIIEKINDDINDIRIEIKKLKDEQLLDAKYQRCAMLLVQGLYNIHPKGGKLKAQDINYIKEFLDERADYLLKINPIKEDKKMSGVENEV